MEEQTNKPKAEIVKTKKKVDYPFIDNYNYLSPKLSEADLLDIVRDVNPCDWEAYEFEFNNCIYGNSPSTDTHIRIGAPRKKYLLFGPLRQKVDVYSVRFLLSKPPAEVERVFDHFYYGVVSNQELQDFYLKTRPRALKNKNEKYRKIEKEREVSINEERKKNLKKLEHILGPKEEISQADILCLAKSIKPEDWEPRWCDLTAKAEGTDIEICLNSPQRRFLICGSIGVTVEIGGFFLRNVYDQGLVDFYQKTHNLASVNKKSKASESAIESYESLIQKLRKE